LTLSPDGTFTYVASATWATSDSFVYCGNGATTGAACATVTLNPEVVESASGITCSSSAFTSATATLIKIPNPGVLAACKDALGYPLTVVASSIVASSGLPVVPDVAGGFAASIAASGTTFPGGTYSFTFKAQNAQGTMTAAAATATVTFPAGSGLTVTVADGKQQTTTLSDYRWIIEEDQTFYIDPNCTTNPPGGTCPGAGGGALPLLGTNFHTSNMPFVAQGCTGPLSCETGQMMVDTTGVACTATNVPAECNPTFGQHIAAVCDVGNGVCRRDTSGNGKTAVMPGAVALDPTKRYYISVLPGDAANPFIAGNAAPDCANYTAGAANCGHSMGGGPIAVGQKAVTVLVETDPFPPAKLAIDAFEDDFPLNGEQDAGGGVDIIAPLEPGLGGFNIVLWDDMGGSGDVTGPGYPACGNSTIGKFLANTNETVPLPSNLRVPGAVYCGSADCTGLSIATGPVAGGSSGPGGSTGRIDPPWVPAEGWQGYSGQNNFIEFGKTSYVPGENGGIHGHVVYASTRPFDDPQMLVQTQWEPLVPNVTINLYQEGIAADGITPTLTLVDTTQTTSRDAFAQGFRSDGIPNTNCPGQATTDLFYFSLYKQENYLNLYNAQHGGPAAASLPYNSQYKCYDGMHNWNQLQPAPFDGMYSFPSVTGLNPTSGNPC
jgi:hypothetical protein